jgi:hypothetical protein
MWEALTDWSEDDPKWLVIIIIIGAWGIWMGYRNWKHEEKIPWIKGSAIESIRDNIRTIFFGLIFIYGFIEFFRRLFIAFF